MSSDVSFLDIRKQPTRHQVYAPLSRITSASRRIWKRFKPKDKKPCKRKIDLETPSAVTSVMKTNSHTRMQHIAEKPSTKSLGGENPGSTARKSNGYDSSSKQRVPSW